MSATPEERPTTRTERWDFYPYFHNLGRAPPTQGTCSAGHDGQFEPQAATGPLGLTRRSNPDVVRRLLQKSRQASLSLQPAIDDVRPMASLEGPEPPASEHCDCDPECLFPRPTPATGPAAEIPSTQHVTNRYAPRKWESLDGYLQASDYPGERDVAGLPTRLSEGGFRCATITVPRELPGPEASGSAAAGPPQTPPPQGGGAASSLGTDLDSKTERSSSSGGRHQLSSQPSTGTPDTTTGSSEAKVPAPAAASRNPVPSGIPPDQLRTLQIRIACLVAADHAAEQRHLEDLVDLAHARGRDEALGEVWQALRHRAATGQRTMGRAERLILEREADAVFRMTSEEPASAVQGKMDALLAKRVAGWRALEAVLESVLEKPCWVVDAAERGCFGAEAA